MRVFLCHAKEGHCSSLADAELGSNLQLGKSGAFLPRYFPGCQNSSENILTENVQRHTVVPSFPQGALTSFHGQHKGVALVLCLKHAADRGLESASDPDAKLQLWVCGRVPTSIPVEHSSAC